MDQHADAPDEDEFDSPAYWRANERVALVEMLNASWYDAQRDPEVYAQRQQWKARYDVLMRTDAAKTDGPSVSAPARP